MSETEFGGPRDSEASIRRIDLGIIAALALWVVVSRVPYMDNFPLMGKDGVFYIEGMRLDRSYNVPPPGNIGYVLLGKAVHQVVPDPVHAFEVVAIGFSVLASALVYLVGREVLPRPIAAASAFALTCSATVWWHCGPITSYLVWLTILPAVALFGIRFIRHGRMADLIGSSLALGLGTILRQDLVATGAPLWLGCLLLGRASWRGWLAGIAIVALCCFIWFLGTSAVFGGIDVYLAKVEAKHAHDMEHFSFLHRGLVEGLARNGSKYAVFLAWAAHLALLPFAYAVWRCLAQLRSRWRLLLLGLLWVGPSWYFSFFIFAGNAGLIFPFLPLVFIGAGLGFHLLLGERHAWRAAASMFVLALGFAVQFMQTPLLEETNQRRIIVNEMFFKYGGPALRKRYNCDLADRGMDLSLRSLLKQLRRPDPDPRLALVKTAEETR